MITVAGRRPGPKMRRESWELDKGVLMTVQRRVDEGAVLMVLRRLKEEGGRRQEGDILKFGAKIACRETRIYFTPRRWHLIGTLHT
jgi:hypothetical protein